MQAGISFQCRDLDNPDGKEFMWHFRTDSVHNLSDPNDVKTVADADAAADYFVPANEDFVAVDSLLLSEASLFQTTIAERHEMEISGLIKALDLLPELPEMREYKLYFAVPEHRFPNFKKQKIVAREGAHVQRNNERVKNVRQFALKVVLPRPPPARIASAQQVCLLRL